MKIKDDPLTHKGTFAQQSIAVSVYFGRKFWPVRIVGAILLIGSGPIILLLVLIVRLTSPGPGLYRQERSGRHGTEFMMYKIRTMYQDAEAVSGPVWCRPGDSRITPIGKLLRFLHLDELPQLINVAKGEMDLIGPRPERPAIVAKLMEEVPNYHTRLFVLPGVTGLAQINLPPDVTTDCVRKKVILDQAYIGEASMSLDLRILMCTLLRMVGVRHGRAAQWLGVERQANIGEVDKRVAPHPIWEKPELHSAPKPHRNGHGGDFALVGSSSDMISEECVDSSEANNLAFYSAPRPR